MTAALAIQAIASGMMCGIIWFVQVIHYPLFAMVPPADSASHARENLRRTRPVVLVPMILEAVSAAWIAFFAPPGISRLAAVAGLALLAAIWISTAFVQMPLHGRLARGEGGLETVDRLVATNRVRTLLWTLRALLSAWMLLAVG